MKTQMMIGAVLSGCAFYSNAVTIDMRHEYLDVSEQNRNRILVSHRFASGVGLSIEGMFKSGGNNTSKPFSDIVDNGTEYTVSYLHKMTPSLNVQPGLGFATGSSTSVYKPYLRAQYSFVNGVYVSGRYRYEYVRNTTQGKDDEHVNRGDIWLGYRYDNLIFELNGMYKKSDQIKYDNRKEDYEYNGRVAWKYDANWTPYAELGNVAVSASSSDRQTRYRLGLQYTF